MKLDQTIGSIANIETMPEYISEIDSQIKSKTLPMLLCKQELCLCGTCAPKSVYNENLNNILKIYNA